MESIQSFLPFIFMLVIIYFMMIRPQQQKAKKEKAFESALKVGDRVITKAGIHGKVHEINEKTIVLETMAGKLLFEKAAISLELSMRLREDKKA
ncbi:preprotein translocase subunit YajC [Flavobacterium agricola]|uniref:Sec translocon accessory complex subunit YajC n=1 Tax=Flavobacterium agricola TaxID=2870839 RepID=A0ABY6LVW2_9FLAO|nr:preprotein translocase subunit YajC [Flavobacterium agricola]UYW00371.1 preprotein translocase subunit YajC [Flavobacterium agricola]